MPNNFQYELTDPISKEKGLYFDNLKGSRKERSDIFERLLRSRIMAIKFIRKSDASQSRLAICTRNDCWIKYDMDEEARVQSREYLKSIAVNPNTAPSKPRTTIYQTGIIPVYDIMKGNWISFDVDYVEAIHGVISTEIDMIMLARKEYGRLGLKKNPDTVTSVPGAGGGGASGHTMITYVGDNSTTHKIVTGGTVITAKDPGPWRTVSGTSITETDISEAKDLLNLPQDADVPKPVTKILADYFDAMIRQDMNIDSDTLRAERAKQNMIDKVNALYKKVP